MTTGHVTGVVGGVGGGGRPDGATPATRGASSERYGAAVVHSSASSTPPPPPPAPWSPRLLLRWLSPQDADMALIAEVRPPPRCQAAWREAPDSGTCSSLLARPWMGLD